MTAAPGSGHPDASGGVPPAHSVASCYRHPMRETMIRCVRCDRPICSECMRPAPVGFQCPDDVKLGQATQRPLRTTVGARQRLGWPVVTVALVTINVVVYVITAVQSVYGFNQPSRSALFEQWQMLPARVDDGDYYRLLTSAFLHANVLHIAMNMFALVIVGPQLERILGWWRYLTVYLLGALGGSVAIYLFGARFSPVVGASGAIFGLFAAALVLVRELGLDRQWLIGIIVLNLVVTFSVPEVSKLGHLGGLVCGGVAALAIAGTPTDRRRLATRTQALGLLGIGVLLLVAVVARTAAF
jgi:membrane associated rhomboid family serine protease